jgi:two-component system response regulator QseB
VSDRPRLLFVEDSTDLAEMITEVLTEEGYAVEHVVDGQAGLHRALTRSYDALLIDRGVPGIEGVDLVRRLRRRGVAAPAMFLTARGSVTDRVEGLDAGAEDYLVKPFEMEELLARLRALLRRHPDRADSLDLGAGRALDVAGRRVLESDGTEVELSGRECELLRILASRRSRTFTRDELLDRVFDDADSQGAVDTYVYYLRRKLGRDIIRTVHGVGYRMGV